MKDNIIILLIAILASGFATSCGSNSKTDTAECEEEYAYEEADVYENIDDCPQYIYTSNIYEEEEIDMTANITYYTSDGNVININRDSYGNISGHDINGNYISGYSDQYGNTSIHDINGNYTYSHTDEYGYTTGHDLNGNYYSAYTDDFGNTTVNIY